MKKLKLPIIKTDFMPPQCKNMDDVVRFLMLPFKNKLVDRKAVRLQKKWMRVDEAFRIIKPKKAA